MFDAKMVGGRGNVALILFFFGACLVALYIIARGPAPQTQSLQNAHEEDMAPRPIAIISSMEIKPGRPMKVLQTHHMRGGPMLVCSVSDSPRQITTYPQPETITLHLGDYFYLQLTVEEDENGEKKEVLTPVKTTEAEALRFEGLIRPKMEQENIYYSGSGT